MSGLFFVLVSSDDGEYVDGVVRADNAAEAMRLMRTKVGADYDAYDACAWPLVDDGANGVLVYRDPVHEDSA